MNFLGHAVLSNSQPRIMVGNFIADFVKGKRYEDYPAGIREGILLHREIDFYTDQHRKVRQSKRRLQARYRHYAGVIVDMYYDHLLAANSKHFLQIPLSEFINQFYQTIELHRKYLPETALRLFHYMSRDNWLLGYSSVKGIEHALRGISRRTRFNSKMEYAGEELRTHYPDFKAEFMVFFPEISQFAADKLKGYDGQ